MTVGSHDSACPNPVAATQPPVFSEDGIQAESSSVVARSAENQGSAEASRSATDLRYPRRFPGSNSDTASHSPWSRKYILALDGGGVRGYSSLLVLRELLSIIAKYENGDLPLFGGHEWEQAMTSADYPWYRGPHANEAVSASSNEQTIHPANLNGHLQAEPVETRSRSERSSQTCVSHREQNPLQQPDGISPDETEREDLSNFRIHHYFDFVGGTSTGGLSALMLSRMKMDIDTALDQYKVVGNDVFATPRPKATGGGFLRPRYPAELMETTLLKVLRNGIPHEQKGSIDVPNIRMRNENKCACHTAVFSLSETSTHKSPYIFRSYDHFARPKTSKQSTNGQRTSSSDILSEIRLNDGPASLAKLWKVARATSAAPGYFPGQKIENTVYWDGGLAANNPAPDMFRDIRQLYGTSPELVVSIGTGSKPDDEQDRHQAYNGRPKSNLFRNIRGLFNLAKRFIGDITDSEMAHRKLHEDLLRERIARDSTIPMYFRFNVGGISNIKMDEWILGDNPRSPDGVETLDRIREATKTYLEGSEIQERLHNCAKELVRMRRNRAVTERWESYATVTYYTCPSRRCQSPDFESRELLRRHAFESHGHFTRVQLGNKLICTVDECSVDPQEFALTGDAFDDHLRARHNTHREELKSNQELEEWLDQGRHTVDALFLPRG